MRLGIASSSVTRGATPEISSVCGFGGAMTVKRRLFV